MHSLPTLSHYKNKLFLHIKKENSDGVAAYTASGADSWHCLQMLMDWMYVTKQKEHLNAHG